MLAAASECNGIFLSQWHHRCAAAFVGAQGGATSTAGFKVKPGQVPLFVYYRVSVLFNKWNISDRAVTIV